jgi:hypothetical protein
MIVIPCFHDKNETFLQYLKKKKIKLLHISLIESDFGQLNCIIFSIDRVLKIKGGSMCCEDFNKPIITKKKESIKQKILGLFALTPIKERLPAYL